MDGDKMKKQESGVRSQESGVRIQNKKTKREHGFSLIEILVAIVILAVGLLGVSLMQVVSISGNTFSREMAVATGLAQDMVEKLKTFEWTDTVEDTALAAGNHPTQDDKNNGLAPGTLNASATDECDHPNIIVDERGLQVGPLVYIRTWTVTDGTPATDMKEIDVTVGWKEKGTTCRSVTITGVKVQS